MRFFASRTARTGWHISDGTGFGDGHWVLVTSEQYRDQFGTALNSRRYTVRHWVVSDCGRAVERIDTQDDFQAFATSAGATRAACKLVEELANN
jgi:hypothetical protein